MQTSAVTAQPLRTIARITIRVCVCSKSQTDVKILHSPIGTGGTALAAAVPYAGRATTFPTSFAFVTAVPYPGRATQISCKGK